MRSTMQRMGHGAVRSEFGRPRGNVAKGLGLTVTGVLLLAIVVGTWIWVGAYPARLTLLVVFGLPVTVLGVYLLETWLPTYRLVIGEHGIELRRRRRTVVLPWDDVEYWWLGIPATAAGRQKGGAGRLCLLVKPAAHVDDPAAGSRRSVWIDRWQRWAVCEPALTDEKPNEIVTAMRHFAGRLEAHVIRADAGAVGNDTHTVGPTTTYLPKLVNVLVIGSVILGAMVMSLVAAPGIVDAAGIGILVLALALLTVVVISYGEAAYLWWHWRQHRTMTVSVDGIALRTRQHDVTIPWDEIAHWTVGIGSRKLTLFMGARNAPNRAVRTPVRDIVLAVPAEHVQDPTAGPLGTSWSRRHRAWVLCQVSHTNATTGEIVGLLRRFSAEKEAASRA